MEETRRDYALWAMVAVAVAVTAASAIHPHDYATWFFELMLGWIGVGVLLAIHPWVRFSGLVYYVCAVHVLVLGLGAHYTYAEMPLFNWLKDALGFSRNHFDRVGHFFQGFTPALLTREVLLRRTGLGRGKMLALVTVAVPLAFSAMYEILEALWVQLFYRESGPSWLGMQGDIWDAQWDMFMAFTGAVVVVAVFSRLHDRSMGKLESGRHI
jgi:putative membrane protein